MIRILISTLSLIACFTTLPACGDPEPAKKEVVAVQLSETEISLPEEGGEKVIQIIAPGEWDAVATDPWIRLEKSNTLSKTGTVKIIVTSNGNKEERSSVVTVMSGAARGKINVKQAPRTSKPADPSMNVPAGYELVWSDDFNGSELNSADWTHEVWNPGNVNNELQAYVNGSWNGQRVTEVKNGSLFIRCIKTGNNEYKSGRIYAHVNEGWRYGIFEARIKLPKGRGTWPAFWMLPANNNWTTNPWPRCGEIDIMEEVGFHPDYTSSSIHCEAYNHTKGTQKTAERYTQGAESDFHVYRLEWTADYIKTYVDGNLLFTFNNDGKGDINTWPFKTNFYIILNLAWGGMWGGQQGVDDKALPATMEVDYVRVFQK